MRLQTTRAAARLLLLLPTLLAVPAWGADARGAKVNFTIAGTILKVDDGDTLTLLGAGGGRLHIRLSDLDAPEIEHAHNPYLERRSCPRAARRAPAQALGEAALAALKSRAPRKAAARAECYTIDRYARSVCHVFVGDTNLNLAQLRDGWGMLLSKRSWVRDPESAVAERAARSAQRGIWAAARPRSPDSWRARCWCEDECGAAP